MEKTQFSPKLLIATNNAGKLSEYRALLADLPLTLTSPAQELLAMQVVEDGETYHDNARKKALAFARASGLLTLADDSGLEVDALDGAPGIYSARYSPLPQANDADRRRHLLETLASHPRPWTARFRCVIAIYTPQGETLFCEGTCEGEIIPEERGNNGFGYDPVFLLPELGRTMAELSMDEKNRISHRANAAKIARTKLLGYLAKMG